MSAGTSRGGAPFPDVAAHVQHAVWAHAALVTVDHGSVADAVLAYDALC